MSTHCDEIEEKVVGDERPRICCCGRSSTIPLQYGKSIFLVSKLVVCPSPPVLQSSTSFFFLMFDIPRAHLSSMLFHIGKKYVLLWLCSPTVSSSSKCGSVLRTFLSGETFLLVIGEIPFLPASPSEQIISFRGKKEIESAPVFKMESQFLFTSANSGHLLTGTLPETASQTPGCGVLKELGAVTANTARALGPRAPFLLSPTEDQVALFGDPRTRESVLWRCSSKMCRFSEAPLARASPSLIKITLMWDLVKIGY